MEVFLSTPSVGRATSPATPSRPSRTNFYPRPPWGGRLDGLQRGSEGVPISIHALRGEGDRAGVGSGLHDLISIHALRGEGDLSHVQGGQGRGISIHALRGEGDQPISPLTALISQFLSTPSVGRATRGGGFGGRLHRDFYPRPPWGGRRLGWVTVIRSGIFLSTPSVGRATRAGVGSGLHDLISIHALRGEGDRWACRCPAH